MAFFLNCISDFYFKTFQGGKNVSRCRSPNSKGKLFNFLTLSDKLIFTFHFYTDK